MVLALHTFHALFVWSVESRPHLMPKYILLFLVSTHITPLYYYLATVKRLVFHLHVAGFSVC